MTLFLKQSMEKLFWSKKSSSRQKSAGGPTPSRVRVSFIEADRPTPTRPLSACISPSSCSPVTGDQSLLLLHNSINSAVSAPNSSTFTVSSSGKSTTDDKMPFSTLENTEENPFRPDGDLSFEVEPIVQQYKRRPWPLSPSGSFSPPPLIEDQSVSNGSGSPTKHPTSSLDSGAANDPHSPHRQNGTISSTSPNETALHQNQLQHQQPLAHSTPIHSNSNSNSNDKGPYSNHNQVNNNNPDSAPPGGKAAREGGGFVVGSPNLSSTAEVQHRTLVSPRAGHVEVVHVDGKKKGCCSVQ